jgi:hypothetical protein
VRERERKGGGREKKEKDCTNRVVDIPSCPACTSTDGSGLMKQEVVAGEGLGGPERAVVLLGHRRASDRVLLLPH